MGVEPLVAVRAMCVLLFVTVRAMAAPEGWREWEVGMGRLRAVWEGEGWLRLEEWEEGGAGGEEAEAGVRWLSLDFWGEGRGWDVGVAILGEEVGIVEGSAGLSSVEGVEGSEGSVGV